MKQGFANQVVILIGILGLWISYALGQRRIHRWLTSEGKINMNWQRGLRSTSPFAQILVRHPHWKRTYGTVVDVKCNREGNMTVYQPIFSYIWYEQQCFNFPSSEKEYVPREAHYSFNKYPIGTHVMLLIPEGRPEEIYVLEDVLKVDIKGIVVIGVFVVPFVAFNLYRLIFL